MLLIPYSLAAWEEQQDIKFGVPVMSVVDDRPFKLKPNKFSTATHRIQIKFLDQQEKTLFTFTMTNSTYTLDKGCGSGTVSNYANKVEMKIIKTGTSLEVEQSSKSLFVRKFPASCQIINQTAYGWKVDESSDEVATAFTLPSKWRDSHLLRFL